jgi:hypothetical protein
MPIKNNDDVAHLLDSTGRAGSSYREFESSSEQMSAPLLDAVFSSGPPDPSPDDQRPLAGGSTRNDLLSEVFDTPKPVARPEPSGGFATPVPPPDRVVETPRAPGQWAVASAASGGRSLSDIRRIISQPSEEATEAPPNDNLHGLFDRLAG